MLSGRVDARAQEYLLDAGRCGRQEERVPRHYPADVFGVEAVDVLLRHHSGGDTIDLNLVW
jgi:hypothetical protein